MAASDKTRNLIVHLPQDWTGTNESGWAPIDDKVIVLPDTVQAKTAGGITLPSDPHDKEQMRIEFGRLVAIGAAAFQLSGDRVRVWDETHRKPQVGDLVFFERYAGQLLDGADGRTYRLMDDKCIAAVCAE